MLNFLKALPLFIVLSIDVSANDIDNRILIDGEVLYTEECQRCHDNSLVPINDNTSMESLNDVREQISLCVGVLNIPWLPEDEEDVALYLNHDFFHFGNTLKAND